MIIDKLNNILFYKSLLPNIENGLEKLKIINLDSVGKYEFDGGFLIIQEGNTKPLTEGTYEAHKKFIDIQIMLDGSEELAWDDLQDLIECIPYNEEKDATRYKGKLEHTIKITKGMFYIAFPHDGHKPVSHQETQQHFKKIIMKLPVA